jgi:hypothetical protein
MSNNTLKILIGTAAGVVIVAGAGWGISTAMQHMSRQKAIDECTPESAKLGLASSTVELLEERRLRYGGESFAECMAGNGQNPAPWAR